MIMLHFSNFFIITILEKEKSNDYSGFNGLQMSTHFRAFCKLVSVPMA